MKRLKHFLQGFFSFSPGERKGLLILLPLLLVVGIVVFVGRRPAGDRNLEMLADARQQAGAGQKARQGWRNGENRDSSESNGDFRRDYNDNDGYSTPLRGELFVFDPNTIDLEGLCRLGFTKREAAGILSYRKSGKVFHDEYDFAGCYQVSLEMFKRLQNYIVIGDRFRRPVRGSVWQSGAAGATGSGAPVGAFPRVGGQAEAAGRSAQPVGGGGGSDNARTPGTTAGSPIRLHPFDPNTLDSAGFVALGFSPRQAEVIVSYRGKSGGFAKPEDFARCYVVSPEAFACLSPYIAIAPKPAAAPVMVDINRADSAALCAVHGIGPLTAGRIVALRKRLRGFVSVDQLTLVEGITERNFEMMSKEIFASADGISKIDINFATPAELEHPYIPGTMLRKILKTRQLKGGWASIEDMVKEQIMTPEQAARLAPYLRFTPVTPANPAK